MFTIDVPTLDILKVYYSGQALGWRKLGGLNARKYLVYHDGHVAKVEQHTNNGKHLLAVSCTDDVFYNVWFDYFDLATDYTVLQAAVRDVGGPIRTQARHARGVHILRQEPWQALVSAVLFQKASPYQVASQLRWLQDNLGEPSTYRLHDSASMDTYQIERHAFPEPIDILAHQDEIAHRFCDEFGNAPYGIRALLTVSEAVFDGWLDLDALSSTDAASALEWLADIGGLSERAACRFLQTAYHMDVFYPNKRQAKALERDYNMDRDMFAEWYLDGNEQLGSYIQMCMQYNDVSRTLDGEY